MDCFYLVLDGICLVGQGVMHIFFTSRLTGKKQKLWYFAVYIFLLIILQHVSVRLSLSGTLPIAVCVLELYAISRFGMGNQESVSWLAAVLAFYVSQLSFGIINSVEAAIFPHFIGNPLLYLLLLAAQAVFLCCASAIIMPWENSWPGWAASKRKTGGKQGVPEKAGDRLRILVLPLSDW